MKKNYEDVLFQSNLSSSEKMILLYLKSIAKDNKTSISLIQLAQSLGLTKPTVIRVLSSLEKKGILKKTNEGKRYSKNIYEIKTNI